MWISVSRMLIKVSFFITFETVSTTTREYLVFVMMWIACKTTTIYYNAHYQNLMPCDWNKSNFQRLQQIQQQQRKKQQQYVRG